mgnify:CR=1 FL=1
MYTLYLNLESGETLATNHQESGVHFAHTLGRNLAFAEACRVE